MFEILLKIHLKCLQYHEKIPFLQTVNDQCDFALRSHKVIKTGNILKVQSCMAKRQFL